METLRNRPALVGRDREQRQLRDWLASACVGNGGLVLVGGEAGIGKTALVRDVTDHARSQGTLVLTGACYDLTTTPPYGPWIEVIRSYTPGGVAPPVPALVRQVIERRLTQLPATAREVLEIAAIIGYTVDFDLWQAVCNADSGQLAVAIDAARHSQLIEEVAGRTGFQFRHALVRETLYAAVNPLLLRDLHQQVAERLIDQSSPDPDAVAYHLGRAGDARQVEWLISAGERAQRRFAWHSAVERFESAQQLLADAGDREDDRGWLLLRIGLLLRFSDQRASIDYLEHAARVARTTGDRPLAAFARFYVGVARHYIDLSGVPEIEAGVAAIDDLHEPEMADVSRRIEQGGAGYLPGVIGIGDQRGTLASALFQIGRLEDAVAAGESFIDSVYSRTSDANQAVAFCRDSHGGLAVAYALIGQPRLARQMFTLAEQGYRSIGNHWVLRLKVQENLNLFILPYYTDNIDDRNRTEALVLDAWHQVTRVTQDYEDVVLRADYGLGFIDGRWHDAMAAAKICSDHRWDAITRQMAYRAASELYFHLGNVDRFWECVATTLPQGPQTEPGTTFISTALRLQQLAAEQSLNSGDLEAARDWLEANDRWFAWSKALLLRAEGQIVWTHYALQAGVPDAARAYAERARTLASDPRQPLALISTRRTLGELDTLEQSFESAGTHLAAALTLAERCQAPYEVALVLLAQAELARACGETRRAAGLLQRARTTFEALKALPALDRATRLAEEVAGKRQYPAGLSLREVEILCLVAGGLSNRDIATELYLSVRTIDRHITNIYRKIDVHNRVEAAAFVQHYRLTMPGGDG